MHITIISASMRSNSQSLKVSNWLRDHAGSLGAEVEVLDLHALELPMFNDEDVKSESVENVLSTLGITDAAIFVSPEWNGMMSHGLINMQHYLVHELAHKPVMLVGVSSGRGGKYPVMQMRTMGYKNNHYVISPESLVVQGVKDVFNDLDMSEESSDYLLKARASYAIKILMEYAKTLQQVRSSSVVDFKQFGNGV